MALVTVIIPSYNCEKYIQQTIDCVLAQTYPAIELIVVDDGSTDATRELVRGYGDRVTLICKENGGVCAARNLGIEAAKGDFICLMDHDDYWYPEKIRQQITAFEQHPEYGVVYSSFQLWLPNETGAFPEPAAIESTVAGDTLDMDYSGWIHHLLLLDCWVLTSTAMFRKQVFAECGNFDVNLPYSEDWDLWFRIAQHYQFLKLAKAHTLYRQHPLQGNRKLREIDYRTRLLIKARQKWGLASKDGRSLSDGDFRRQLAKYHAEYALHHLQGDSLTIARNGFLTAWKTYPAQPKYLAYFAASFLGWKPNY